MNCIYNNLTLNEFIKVGGVIEANNYPEKINNKRALKRYNKEFPEELLTDHIDSAKIGDFEYSFNRDCNLFIVDKCLDPFGIKNVNFTLESANKIEGDKLKEERLEKGFDTSEVYNLDYTIANFICPRLKSFIEKVSDIQSYPSVLNNIDEWKNILSDMLTAFEILSEDDFYYDKEVQDKIDKGLDYFSKYYTYLWW